MSKQITPQELADLVSKLLTQPGELGQLDSSEQFSAFFTGIAEVVCEHCGGQVSSRASDWFVEDEWFVGIRADEFLPEDGGVWSAIDPDGDLEFSLLDEKKPAEAFEPHPLKGNVGYTNKEVAVAFRPGGITYDLVVPAQVRCVYLGRWIVDDLSWMKQGTMVHHDAEHYGIEIPYQDIKFAPKPQKQL